MVLYNTLRLGHEVQLDGTSKGSWWGYQSMTPGMKQDDQFCVN